MTRQDCFVFLYLNDLVDCTTWSRLMQTIAQHHLADQILMQVTYRRAGKSHKVTKDSNSRLFVVGPRILGRKSTPYVGLQAACNWSPDPTLARTRESGCVCCAYENVLNRMHEVLVRQWRYATIRGETRNIKTCTNGMFMYFVLRTDYVRECASIRVRGRPYFSASSSLVYFIPVLRCE